MAVLTESQLEDIENIIDTMNYKVNNDLDDWYPEIREIKEHITGRSKNDVLFLMWLTNPDNPLTEEQQEVRKKILKLLYNEEILTIKED
ncbi:MAG: hypothetical protein IJO13_05455 [Lachnospiraceae bacterium]|nr:hypothetical protein [Lachnospiraceae bacterium]